MYAAATVTDGDTLLGFARVALPVAEIHANVNRLNRTLIVAGVAAALIATAVATATASRTVRPVIRLTEAVERMAAGDLSGRLLPTTNDEVGKLTRAFNHMADQLQDKVAHLALERARLATVLEQMADGVVITDNSGTITMINTAAARILKYNEDQAVGRRFPQVAYSYQLIDLWNRCYETQEEQSAIVETALYADFVRAVVTPLHRRVSLPSRSLDEDPVRSAGALTTPRYLIMLQDLTHIRRLETIRRDFISNVSHELRTPLASLSLVVETLRDGALDDPPAARRFLDHMESELASLTQMVEELLELSRIESGRVPLELQPTKVRKLILKPVKRLRPQAERKGIVLNLAIPDDLPRVQADAARVQQVVANLLHNAIKFTPTGGTITLSAQVCTPAKGRSPSAPQLPSSPRERSPRCRGEGQLTITVSDTGIGIPPDELQRIFERFYKTDRARAQEGTGLGLAISKHIIEVHGGQIWAESVAGAGSTFSFTLPIATTLCGDHD
jgi:two-component system phosphate regulon sensor histidine kinase PhoR